MIVQGNGEVHMSSLMDVVYIVRPGDDNEELRYSLRSLKNIPHRKVFIAGYKPEWVTGVEYLPVPQSQHKYDNIQKNLQTVFSAQGATDDVIYMNDDFFVMKPIKEVEVLHRGKLLDVIDEYEKKFSPWMLYPTYMRNTVYMLRKLGVEVDDIKSYDSIHVPMVVNRRKWLALQQKSKELFPNFQLMLWRTMYGNYYQLGGREVDDAKVANSFGSINHDATFLSSLDSSFRDGAIGKFVCDTFPDKGQYEV